MGRSADEFAASSHPNSIHRKDSPTNVHIVGPIPETNKLEDISERGIAGRAVFVDWYSWARKQGLEVDALSAYEVPFNQIVETLRFQKMELTSIKPGDILIIRFGYLEQYENLATEKREHLHQLYQKQKPENIGLKPSEELLKFLWNAQIAAICGDSRSLEVWPCKDLQWHLHEWLLAGWGMPIGELFYLEELAKVCRSLDRYTLFLSSSPMNVSYLVVTF